MKNIFDDINKIVDTQHHGDFCEYLVVNNNALDEIDVYLDTCPEHVFERAQEVCANYFALNVPIDLLRKTFKHNPLLAYENSHGAINDTYVRDILADALMGVMMVPRWPLNMDSDEYCKVWKTTLHEQMPKYGVTVCQLH